MKMKKVGATWSRHLKNFEIEKNQKISKMFIGICMKMKNFEIKKFRNFSISKISKIFIGNCMKMKNFEIENFRFFRIRKIFSDPKIFDFFGPKLTVLLEIFMDFFLVKTWWKLWSSTFHKYMVSLCSGARETTKSEKYFSRTAKPMNTP